MERVWKKTETNPPKESDRYWGYVAIQSDLGLSHYQSNVYYDAKDKRWNSEFIEKEGGTVTHWTELLEHPVD